MSLRPLHLPKWNGISLGLGAAAWVGIVLARLLGWITLDDLNILLLLALCLITPLALSLVPLPQEKRSLCELARLILLFQPFATLISGTSLLSDRGFLAAIEALVWLLFTLLIALLGGMMLFQERARQRVTASPAVALLYMPIGGIWLVVDRLGLQPFGFSQTTVLLTAVHFHFITLAALPMVGLIGRAIDAAPHGMVWKIYRVLASCMLVNPLLVATGITVTQVTGMHWLESGAGTLFALCLIMIALINLRCIVPTTTSLLARMLLIISSSAVVFTMLVAGVYTVGAATRLWTITISQMILIHGWINALVFGLCGLLGWRLRSTQEGRKACE